MLNPDIEGILQDASLHFFLNSNITHSAGNSKILFLQINKTQKKLNSTTKKKNRN